MVMGMFSRFRNSNIGYYTYTALVLAIGAGSLVFFYFMVTGFNIGVYEANTVIGNVYVGGLTEEEAEQKVRERVSIWLEDDSVTYETGYQGYYYEIDRDLLNFDFDATMANVRNGTRTPLVVSFPPSALNTIDFELNQMHFMEDFTDQFDIEDMIDDILADAAVLRELSRKQLNNYIIDRESFISVVSEGSAPLLPGMDGESLIERIEAAHAEARLPLPSMTALSVLDSFGDEFSSAELDIIGSALLDAIIPTRIGIIERHYNPRINFDHFTVDDYPYFGKNVRVNRPAGFDFVIENECFLDFVLEFHLTPAGDFGVRIKGCPYVDTIEVERIETVIPSETLTTSHPQETQDGHNGRIVRIKREIHASNGEVLDTYEIVFEHYAPVNEIIYTD